MHRSEQGSPPRKIEIERRRREYMSKEMADCLKDLHVSDASQLLPCGGLSGRRDGDVFELDLALFDDTDFDSRPAREWHALCVKGFDKRDGVPAKTLASSKKQVASPASFFHLNSFLGSLVASSD